MNIKSCEKKEKSSAEIIVGVDAEEFDSAIGKAYIKMRNQISVPGFRKGKAPRKIVEKMYGATVFHPDALEALMPAVLKIVADESELDIVGRPQISDVDVKDAGEGAEITVTVALYPEVTIGEYKGLTAVKPEAEVPESEVDGEVEAIRLRNARIDKTDRPAADGDIAVIDYEGFVDGVPFDGGKDEGYELELGSKTFIPGFEDKLLGMVAGEEREIDLVFPENYAEHLAGKPVVFKVKLGELKERILPEADDEFAKDVSEFDTLEEYRSDIREKLRKTRQADADAVFENRLMDKLVESLDAEVPEAMIEEQMDNSVETFAKRLAAYGMEPAAYLKAMKISPADFRENMRESSEKQVRIMLALEKIAELEAIELSEEEIENEYNEAAKRYNMELDKLKESVDEKDITRDLKVRRAAQVVVDSAVIDDNPEPTGEDAQEDAQDLQDAQRDAVDADKPKKAAVRKPKPKKDADAQDGEQTAQAEKGDEE